MKLKLWVKFVLSIILIICSIVILFSLSGNGTNNDLLKLLFVEINGLIIFIMFEDKIKEGE